MAEITYDTTGGGVVIRTSVRRWLNATGLSTINKIKVFVEEASGSTLLQTLTDLNLTGQNNYYDLIQIKIPKETLPTSFRGISIEVDESESYSWFGEVLNDFIGWVYLDLLQ